MSAMVWKYRVKVTDEFTIDMPEGAQVLGVQMQHDHPYIWALVDPQRPLAPRTFALFGTGHGFDPCGLAYVGTFQMHGGAFVFHLFARAGGAS